VLPPAEEEWMLEPRCALALICLFVTTAVQAQGTGGIAGFPQKPLRIIVSSAPGGGQDLTTRPIAHKLSESLAVPVVVDNRGGASGIVAMDVTRQAAPDGYTLLVGATSMILMGVTNKVSYDIRKAFDPLVPLTSQPYLLVLHPSMPATTPKEFVAFARTKPGILTYGTSGPGSLHNLGMDWFQSITGIKLIHVPYKGSGPALVDLLAGQINLMFTSTTSGGAHVKSGKLRAIAVTSPTRLAVYPELPTLAETVAPGYELGNNYSMFAPAGTPKPVLRFLNAAIARVVHAPDLRDKFAADGATPAPALDPDKFKEAYGREVARWEQFAKKHHVQP
jgi:tripartite-type tricarboxylate transporter receptor subunit TctC